MVESKPETDENFRTAKYADTRTTGKKKDSKIIRKKQEEEGKKKKKRGGGGGVQASMADINISTNIILYNNVYMHAHSCVSCYPVTLGTSHRVCKPNGLVVALLVQWSPHAAETNRLRNNHTQHLNHVKTSPVTSEHKSIISLYIYIIHALLNCEGCNSSPL